MSNVAVNESVYEWRAPIPGDLARKERLTLISLFGAGLISMGWGVTSAVGDVAGDVRFLVVMGLMMLGLGVLGAKDSRRLRSTLVRIDRMGTLVVSDAESTSSLDLRTVSALAIQRRSGRPQWRWSIEAVHPGGAWHAELSGLATYWNLDDATISQLEAELQRWLGWATGSVVTPTESASPSTAATASTGAKVASFSVPMHPIAVRGTITSTPRVFEWQPPEHPNKARNRRRVRIGLGAFALSIAVLAAVSEAENGVGAVLMSMFVPVLILLIGFGIDRFYEIGRRFRIGVDESGLSIRRSSGAPNVIPAADIRAIDINLTSQVTFDADVDSSSWHLQVLRADGENVSVALPLYLGRSFGRDDAIALEGELRRRLGVTA